MVGLVQALSMLTGFDVVAVNGHTFTFKHTPTGFTFKIGPSGNPFTPLEGVTEAAEEFIFQPLDLGQASEVCHT
jgi:hypothetical protein